MKNDDIKTSTPVRHPAGGGYVIQRLSMNGAGEILNAAIGKDLHATPVFDGHPDVARKHGFLFGDEGQPDAIANGTIITHTAYPDRLYGYEPLEVVGLNSERTYRILRGGALISTGTVAELTAAGFRFNEPEVTVDEIEALLEPVEPAPSAMRQAWLASEEAVRELEANLADRNNAIQLLNEQVQALQHEVTAYKERVAEGVAKRDAVYSDLSEFREQVRDAVIAEQKARDFCKEGTNEFLEELGLAPMTKTFTVKVTRDSDSELLLTVTGVEADDSDGAQDHVIENFTVTATVKEVHFDYEYGGDGEADWDEEDHDDDNWDETDDEIASSHEDGLTFTAEEE